LPIPNPSIDDKSYLDIVEESKKKISVYSKRWTDYNVSDPGITFLELFSWLAESQIYSLNKISLKNYLKFLRLLGHDASIKPASPPKLHLTFNGSNLREPLMISKSTLVNPSDLTNNIAFDTDEDLLVLPLRISKMLVSTKQGYEDHTLQNDNIGNGCFYPFTESPSPGISAFYVGLENLSGKLIDDLSGQLLCISFYVFEDDLPLVGSHGSEDLNVYISTSVIWEYLSFDVQEPEGIPSSTPMQWTPLILNEDSLRALTTNGRISFQIPFEDVDACSTLDLIGTRFLATDTRNTRNINNSNIGNNENNKKLFWIRCRLKESHYEIVPRLAAVLLNTISATFGLIVEKVYNVGNGLPGQLIEINQPNTPVIEIIQVKTIDSNSSNDIEKIWTEVEDFDASTPYDLHFVCNLTKDNILFGNGINGYMPKIDEKIVVKFRTGDVGQNSLINAKMTFTSQSGQNIEAVNYFQSTRGTERESLSDAIARARKDLNIRYKAVTSSNFQDITICTPKTRISRAKAFVSPDDINSVTVIVVPFSFGDAPMPSKGLLKTVCRHLDMHRLITTRLKVKGPDYVGISVITKIRIKKNSNPQTVKDSVCTALANFINPISRNPEQNAWPFGRDVYKSEVYALIGSINGVDCIVELKIFGSGDSRNFDNRDGNTIIRNYSLVYIKSCSVNVVTKSFDKCMIHNKEGR
jgi:predicted phage baseplate assembly protein